MLVVLFAGLIQPILGTKARAWDPYPDDYVFVIVTTPSGLNLRAAPNANVGTPILAVVPNGMRLLALGRNHSTTWFLVEYNSQRGWLAGWLLKVESGNVSDLPDMEGETGNSGGNGSNGHCQLDKIETSSPGGGPTQTEVGGSHWQHLSIWTNGTLEVSFIVKPSVPAERPLLYAYGFVGLWEDVQNRCGTMLGDAIAYINDRPANHTHLVFEVDAVTRTVKLLYNPWGWRVDEQLAFINLFFKDQLRLIQ